jgi:hypothetical protein
MADKEKSIFPFLDNMEEKEKEAGAGEGKPSDDKNTLAPEIQAIIKENTANKKALDELKVKNAELEKGVEGFNKLRDAFVPDKGIGDDDAADRESFAADSYTYTKAQMKKIREEALEEARREIAPLKIDSIVRGAQRELSKKYVLQLNGEEVDWDDKRVQDKVGSELRLLDPEFKQKNPREAMRRAAWAAGVLKERTDELPGYESGHSPHRALSPDQRKKADDAEKAALKGAGAPRVFANI